MSAAASIRAACQCGRAGCYCGRVTGNVHCPVHDSSKGGRPDLSVSDKHGRLLVHCHVCGKSGQDAVVGELKARGLWPGANRSRKRKHTETGRCSWEIRDTTGRLHAIHERIDYADGTKRFVWRAPAGHSGLSGRKSSSLPLYGSELLADAPAGATVVLCEGEKAADAGRRLGLLALGTVTGAGNPIHDDAVLRTLLPFDVVLWPDNDEKGRSHMTEIGRRLLALGVDQ